MKKLNILLAAWLLAFTAHAEHVDLQTAQQIAKTILNRNTIELNDLTPMTEFTQFYILSADDCYVIVAADDCVLPILGYSTTNNFNAANMPANLQGWLEGYEKEIAGIKALKLKATDEISRQWESLKNGQSLSDKGAKSVQPLLTTTWDQGEPYNDSIPQHCYTGCTATATAQVMKYWNHPATGTGSHTYTQQGIGTMTANFGATKYQWELMPNELNNNSSDEQIAAVAQLMFHIGVATEMWYSQQGSGAYVITYGGEVEYCAENALKDYFGYKSTLRGLQKADYSSQEWANMVREDLDNGRPIIYAGYDWQDGHCFVCDGYDNQNKFHFNWGWSGESDGYFELNHLNPGYNFNQDQEAIFGVEPENGGGQTTYAVTAEANPSWAGTIEGAGTYTQNQTVTLTAYPSNPDYLFWHWIEDGEVVSINATYTFTIDHERHLVAEFYDIEGTEENTTNEINIYPNPTQGKLYIEAEGLQKVEIFNLQGQKIAENINDFSMLEKGVYFIKVTTKKTTTTRQIVVK